jgi:hypothetical protein
LPLKLSLPFKKIVKRSNLFGRVGGSQNIL